MELFKVNFNGKRCCCAATMLHFMLDSWTMSFYLIEIDLMCSGAECSRSTFSVYFFAAKRHCDVASKYIIASEKRRNDQRKQWNHIRWFRRRIFTLNRWNLKESTVRWFITSSTMQHWILRLYSAGRTYTPLCIFCVVTCLCIKCAVFVW